MRGTRAVDYYYITHMGEGSRETRGNFLGIIFLKKIKNFEKNGFRIVL
tara:strand:+ start:276 stop:419 length:144 start_codon:yes stop_codon:yes gene_type:complete